ncbi:sigma-70 family RNA polymerase sigma factor [Mycolicibacterium vaccae]|jgi:RNA polymerase sigma-70 factor (ECF subfamily)|uniref:RNA polymerase sigma factor n=1 Tax=Mycolicibacterium vaccae ATCC 25954 TaxID=1194972 RepID=K0V7T5_MYCVA|nr:ECF-family protein sigma factor H [Mycolicibacterium vaccae ATCC 25954]MCV7064335.1 sigma-70 family RNA polymerase sigma factor [Mycolicibacterium vaccae]
MVSVTIAPINADNDFERQVMPLTPGLYRRAYSFTRNAADAEDLVQETLLKAYRGFHTLGPDPHVNAWLLCIMRNTWIARHRATRCRVSEQLVGDFGDSDAVTASAEHVVLQGISDSNLVDALASLPEPMRLAMYYTAVEGMSCREVAEIMSVPVGTVMSRLHRGRDRLRRSLTQPGTRPSPHRTPARPARSR